MWRGTHQFWSTAQVLPTAANFSLLQSKSGKPLCVEEVAWKKLFATVEASKKPLLGGLKSEVLRVSGSQGGIY